MAPAASKPSLQNPSKTSPLSDLEKSMKALAIHNQKYVEPIEPGSKGVEVPSRVNYFSVDIGDIANKIHVYSFSFPSLRGRELKNPAMKKDCIEAVLDSTFLRGKRADLATDWNGTLLSFTCLQNTKDWKDATYNSNDKSISIPVTIDGITDPVNLKEIRTLFKSDLQDYLGGKHSFVDGQASECPTWISALNILVRKYITDANSSTVVKVGRDKFFPKDGKWTELGYGLHARSGHFSSIRPVKDSVVMNVRAVSTAFVSAQSVEDFACAYIPPFKSCKTTEDFRKLAPQFRSACRGLRVRLMYHPPGKDGSLSARLSVKDALAKGRPKRINGFGKTAAAQTFKIEGRGEISVYKYFNTDVLKKAAQLQWPDMLVANVGSTEHPTWIPTELLCIEPHQAFLRMLPHELMDGMGKVARHLPVENIRLIEAAFASNGIFPPGAVEAASRLHIRPKMLEVTARMLDLPTLSYRVGEEKGGRGALTLRGGRWQLTNKKFFAPGQLGPVGIIELEGRNHSEANFSKFAEGLSYGIDRMKVGPRYRKASVLARRSNSRDDPNGTAAALDAAFAELAQSKAVDLRNAVLVILPDKKDYDLYAEIKAWGDTKKGINTVCVTKDKSRMSYDRHGNAKGIPMESAQFQGNLAMKFNVKTGGINHVLHNKAIEQLHAKGTTMVVGADVTHPGPGSVKHCPSIAAVVASFNRNAAVYPGSLHLQTSKQESIANLDGMIVERLRVWFDNNGKDVNQLPKNILVFRDGVSESQFPDVERHELQLIKAGCQNFGSHPRINKPDYNPKVTMVVCGKRHQTRFFPPEGKLQESWAMDCIKQGKQAPTFGWKPGFVADQQTMRSPYHVDFFLQSHMALQGTARPCHYFVLANEMALSADELQSITFNLCWIFQTALTPISQAAPAYYADRLAERGRCYLRRILVARGQSPTEEDLLRDAAGLAKKSYEDFTETASDAEKDNFVLQIIARGDYGLWPKTNVGPMTSELAGQMFYI